MYVKQFVIYFGDQDGIEVEPWRTIYKYTMADISSVIGMQCVIEIQYLDGFQMPSETVDLGIIQGDNENLTLHHAIEKTIYF